MFEGILIVCKVLDSRLYLGDCVAVAVVRTQEPALLRVTASLSPLCLLRAREVL